MINYISEKILLPVSDILLGQSIAKDLKFLLESQWWSYARLKKYQEKKLRTLIKHSAETVPYYEELFRRKGLHYTDIKSVEDLKMLPILTKEVIKEYGKDKFISRKYSKRDLIKKCSSGSTGKPFCHYITKRSNSFFKAVKLRGWYWQGYRLGDKFVKIDNSRKGKLKSLQDIITRNKSIYAKNINKHCIHKIVQRINEYSPKVLRAYPTPLMILLKLAEDNDLQFKEIPVVATTGSILYPEFRKKIKDTFNASVIDAYSNEGGTNAFECHTHECYHSSMEYAITEVIDDDGKSANIGRAIGTDLWNYASPFIRYDSQDVIQLNEKKCSCGRELMAIKKIWGRDTEIIISPEGNMITPHVISKALGKFSEIEQYQLRQNTTNQFELYINCGNNAHSNLSQKLQNVLFQIVSPKIELEIKHVSAIPLLPSGKRRYIYRNPGIDFN